MVKFGMPSLFETDSVGACAALCRRLGLRFVELNANFPSFQPDALDAGTLRQAAEEYGVFFTVHLDDEMNVADFNPLVAQAYRQTVARTLELAVQADIRLLNMHLPRGPVYTLPERKVYFAQAYEEAYLEQICRFRDCCRQWTAGTDIRICVENTNGFLDVQKKALELLLECPAFGLTLDIGHDHCAGGVDGPFILQHRQRLRHMHIHDARRPGSDHLPLGDGELDVARFLELASECDATAVLEVKTQEGLRRCVRWLATMNDIRSRWNG